MISQSRVLLKLVEGIVQGRGSLWVILEFCLRITEENGSSGDTAEKKLS